MKTILSVIFSGLLALPCLAQVPLLNSYPVAKPTIYLDFDGEYVDGTGWNFYGPIDAQPSGLSDAAIREVFERVAEDYRIFNINISTDSAVFADAPPKQRIRIIVTTTNNWYPGAGGTSLIRSFRWGDGTPAWVFSGALGLNIKNIAEAISHEAGHTLGLYHQSNYNVLCTKTAEYSPGKGTGEIGWAPIMGVGYSRNMTTWHTGSNAQGCNVTQNDIDTIAGILNNFGLRTDDHGNSHDDASVISVTPIDFQATGMINGYLDRDVFSFTIATPTNVRINAVPQNVGSGNNGANVDIKVGLLSSVTDTIGKYNPMELLNAGVDTNLNAGTYFIVVDGVSNENLPDYGSVGSYALIGSIAQVLPIHHLQLKGRVSADQHLLSWNFTSDEPIKKLHLEVSADGTRFSTLAELPADAKNFSWNPFKTETSHYRLKVITVADERGYYSNTETLKFIQAEPINILSTVVNNTIQINSKNSCAFQLFDETGRMLQKGMLRSGSNSIDVSRAKTGLLLLRLQQGMESKTYKIMRN
jgi:hypothetical protein